MVVAAEPSADLLTAALLPSLLKYGHFTLHGVYGPHTSAAAVRHSISSTPPFFAPADVAVMGITALIPKLLTLALRARNLVSSATELRPDLALFVDGKGLSRFAAPRIRKGTGGYTRVAQYVAPSVWAWKGGAADVARAEAAYDHMLLLFPFEAPPWRTAGVPHTVVGSPAVEAHLLDLAQGSTPPNIPRPEQVDGMELVVMLGSRTGEVQHHGPLLSRAFQRLPRDVFRRLRGISVPVATPHLASLIDANVKEWRGLGGMPEVRLVHTRGEARRVLERADAAVIASGTAALEAALVGLPAVVVYKTDWLTAKIAKARAKVKFAALPNLLAGRAVVPELLFDRCTPEALADELQLLLAPDPSCRQIRGIAERASVEKLVTDGGAALPSERAARALAPLLFPA